MKTKMNLKSMLLLAAFIVSSFAVVGLTMTGSANTTATSSTSSTSSTTANPEIVFSTGVQTTTTLSDMIADFNANMSATYGFTVKLQESTWETNSQYDTYVANFNAKDSSIDVVSMDVIWPGDFASSGFLLPLDSSFNTTEQAKFLQAPIEAGTVTVNGTSHIYGIPWFHDSAMLFYRTDVLKYAFDHSLIPEDRAPQTWDEMSNWTLAMLGDSGLKTAYNITDGFVWQGKSYEGLICDFMEYLGATGTYSFLNADQTAPIFNSSTGIKDALTYMKSLIDDGVSPKSVLTFDEEGSRAVWNAGNAIFMRNWPYAYALGLQSVYLNGTKAGTNEQQFNVTTMPAQSSSTVDPRTSCLGGWQLGVSAFSKYPAEAKKFALWLTAPEQQLTYFLGAGQTPTRTAVYSEPALLASKQSYVAGYLDVFKAALPRPVDPLYPQMSEKIRGTINSYLGGSISIDSALTTMQSDVQNVITPSASTGYETPVAIMLIVFSFGTLATIRRKRKN
jgi:multiple sugar transport system substrate-binding protein